jgi:hypothetical protein
VTEETVLQFLETPYRLEPPIPRLTRKLITKQPLTTSIKNSQRTAHNRY